MSFLGVAQTYAGKNLLPQQVSELLNDKNLYTEKEGSSNGKIVIEAALNKLGVDSSQLDIRVERSSDGKAASGAFATIRGVGRRDNPSSTSGHYQEGTATGDFRWDPVDGARNTGRKTGEIRNVYIAPKRQNIDE
jgi:hypothetical protein